jgi:hypothetical protein
MPAHSKELAITGRPARWRPPVINQPRNTPKTRKGTGGGRGAVKKVESTFVATEVLEGRWFGVRMLLHTRKAGSTLPLCPRTPRSGSAQGCWLAVSTWLGEGASKAGWKPALRGGGRAKVMFSGMILDCGDRSSSPKARSCPRTARNWPLPDDLPGGDPR